jgi:hypothetical protein
MNTDVITCFFKEAYDTFPPFKGSQPTTTYLPSGRPFSPFSWSSNMTTY